jgi:hypothetical protein
MSSDDNGEKKDDVAVDAHEVPPYASITMQVLHADPVNEGAARDYLTGRSWPTGLQDALLVGLQKIPIRYFICDDSGSMTTMDGMRFEETEENEM